MNSSLAAAVPRDARFALIWPSSLLPALELLKQRPLLKRLILLADSPATLKSWQTNPAAATLLNDRRVRAQIVAADCNDPLDFLPFEDNVFLFEGRVACHIDPAIRLARDGLCTKIELSLLNRVRALLSSVATRTTRGWHAMANAVLNLPQMTRQPGLDELRNIAQGLPAIVVGAGPSLDLNAHDLIPFRNKVFIVACDAALATLRKNGLKPDLAVSSDHSEKTWHFFANSFADHDAMPLACGPDTSWPLIRHGKTDLFFGITQSPRDTLFNQIAGPFSTWNPGICVGHAAFEIACLVGAEPIILIGFDLGYAGDRFHPSDMASPYFHNSPPPKENIIEVAGALGGKIRTEISMLLYLQEFERRFAACNRAVWDATEGGAAKTGTRVISLRAALEESTNQPRIAPQRAPFSAQPRQHKANNVTSCLENWRAQSIQLIKELRRVLENMPAELARGNSAFAFQDKFKDIFMLIAGANNPAANVGFQFEIEDWLNVHQAQTALPERLLEAGKAYIQDLLRCVELIPELTAMAVNVDDPDFADQKTVLTVRLFELPREQEKIITSSLAAFGIQTEKFSGDPGDVPAVWRSLRETRAATVIMLNGALFPATWSMPGTACFDCRTSPPDSDASLNQWHLLPGYAIIGVDQEVARAWREYAPDSCPVYDLPANGKLQPAGTSHAVDWTEALAARLAEARAYLRDNNKTK